MIKYKKFQFGWMIVIIFLMVMVWTTLAFMHQWGKNPINIDGYIFIMILFCGLLSVFYGITIIVTNKQIKIRFGIGFYTKIIDLSDISSVNITKYPVYFGYGIRLLSNGLLYNVSGRHAIEIKLKNKKNIIQIGSNDWIRLKETIERCINIK